MASGCCVRCSANTFRPAHTRRCNGQSRPASQPLRAWRQALTAWQKRLRPQLAVRPDLLAGGGVDFSLSADQRELTEAAADFARRELNEDLAKLEDAGDFPREAWRKCAEFGVQGLAVPAELGGAGTDVLTTALVMEALG